MAAGNGLQKWEQKTQNAGTKWKADVAGSATAYCEGLAKAFGINVGSCMSGAGARFQQGVDMVSAQEFQQSIAGKGNKWLQNTVRGLQGV